MIRPWRSLVELCLPTPHTPSRTQMETVIPGMVLDTQDFEFRWRSGQARMLSALRLRDGGLRTLRPIQRHPLPPPDASSTAEETHEKPLVPEARPTHSPSGSRDALSVEESREEALAVMHPRQHVEYSDPVLEAARSARMGGWGQLMTLGDPHRSWGRGWGSMSGRRAIGARGALDWVGRAAREEDDPRRGEGGRRRLMRSDLSHRMAARGRRAASAESRLDSRRPVERVFHEYDRSEGFAQYRDDESGALLVEFNDGADGETEGREEAQGIEGGSAGSADSGDTSQDGDEMVSLYTWRGISTAASTRFEQSAVHRCLLRSSSENSYKCRWFRARCFCAQVTQNTRSTADIVISKPNTFVCAFPFFFTRVRRSTLRRSAPL